MLKIIHCADIHLGSKMDSKFPKEKAEERRREVLNSFENLIAFAREQGVKIIMLSGDVFDSDKPLKKDKEFFYSVIRNNKDIDFLYLRGNHDSYESVLAYDLENLKTFGESWQFYHYDNICIGGVEIDSTNYNSLYSTLNLDKDNINLIMLHGQVGDGYGKGKVYLSKLRNKNIDYLALGHIHSHVDSELDGRGIYAYSGCLEGRGFDEIGQKGFYLLTIEEKIEKEFIPFSKRLILEKEVDISSQNGLYETINYLKSTLNLEKKNIYQVILKGEIDFDNSSLEKDVQKSLEDLCYFCYVKDKTLRKFNIDDYKGDTSLKGEFIRSVLTDESLTIEQKQNIISYGIKALSGDEVEV